MYFIFSGSAIYLNEILIIDRLVLQKNGKNINTSDVE